MSRFVLVHGAWSDSAAWDAVAARLRSAGHQVAAPDLPYQWLAAAAPAGPTAT